MANNFEEIFEQLKPFVKEFEPEMVVLCDQPGKYYLKSPKLYENKKEIWFGGVEVKKNYVSYHLIPVYAFPELLESISPELKKRMQGKSCFNFTKPDEKVFGELANLTRKGFETFKQKEWI